MAKVNPPVAPSNGGNPSSAVSRSLSKSSFQEVLETTQKSKLSPKKSPSPPEVERLGGGESYSGKKDVLDRLTALLQKGAPASQIVKTALQNNPVFALLSPDRQTQMVKQLTKKVKEDPVLLKTGIN